MWLRAVKSDQQLPFRPPWCISTPATGSAIAPPLVCLHLFLSPTPDMPMRYGDDEPVQTRPSSPYTCTLKHPDVFRRNRA